MMNRRALFGPGIALLLLGLAPRSAAAKTYEVGPGKPYATIQETLDQLGPGDVVEVQGDHTYPGDLWFEPEHSGSPQAPVTVRGIRVNGKRPIIEGVGSEQWHDMIVLFYASNFVFEGFEIIGDGNTDHTGLIHKANNVTLRDLVVHGVGSHGLLGTDSESGSLTLERSEFYNNGDGLYDHQVYMATDESMYPGSVFRMQFCYVHDGAGGNNVKSRAERNEIYSNWIEGAVFHELDLIGPDGQDPSLAREDSDVVGNVLIKHSEWRIARIGGDGTGNTAGRYRFVNNTMVLGEASDRAIGLQETVESVEMHNNVIVRIGGSGGQLISGDTDGPAPVLSGSHNWIQGDFTKIPDSFTDTIMGDKPGFTDVAAWDLRPLKDSPLLEKGTTSTAVGSPAFINPLALPTHVPPSRAIGTEAERPVDATPDIGAFELGTGAIPGPGAGSGGSGAGSGGSGAGNGGSGTGNGGDGGSGVGADGDSGGGCGCRVGAAPAQPAVGLLFLVGVAAARRRRRR